MPKIESADSALRNLLADLDGMLAQGVPPMVLGHWVAVNQAALLTALELAATHQTGSVPSELALDGLYPDPAG